MDTNVTRHSDHYAISVDGTSAGLVKFVDHDGRRIFYHTEVFPEFGGKGLAGTLVGQALEATREEGLRVVAVCPFVKKYVSTHEEWADSVDAVTPEMLRALPAQD